MKPIAVLLLAALASAAPGAYPEVRAEAQLMARQTGKGSKGKESKSSGGKSSGKTATAGAQTSSELENGGCKGSTFIWARGTMEPGNMGWIIGNYLTPLLHKGLGNDIAVQGVKYDAGILTNIGPGMADAKGVSEAQRLFKLAASKCPNTIITGGGYSQGAAIMHRAIEKLDEGVKARIAAMLLYGDTQYASDGQSIKGFPKDRVKVICKSDDGVCVGYITVTAGHLSYSSTAAEGVDWLIEKIKAAKKAPAAPAPAPEAPAAAEAPSEGEAPKEEAPKEEAPTPEPAPKAAKGKGAKGAKGAKMVFTDVEETM